MTPEPESPRRRSRGQRSRREWLGWALVVAVATCAFVFSRWQRLAEIERAEADRLTVLGRSIERILIQQFNGVAAALRGTRADLAGGVSADPLRRLDERMQALTAAMPMVRSMALVDAAGVLVGGTRPQDWLATPTAGGWLAEVRADADPDRIYVSPPIADKEGGVSVSLAVAVKDARRRYAGSVVATIENGHLLTLLDSVQYAPDMRAGIVHDDGTLFVLKRQQPTPPKALRMPDVMAAHVASGLPVSVQRGLGTDGDERLAALRTLQLQQFGIDLPLRLGVSRGVTALRAPWLQQSQSGAALLGGAALASALALRGMQRRRTEREAALATEQARARADAERLRLALHGGDLALWDLDVPGQRSTVNDRWWTMLGFEAGEFQSDDGYWQTLLHPEDRDRVLALLDDHLQGRCDGFEASYRLRHCEGHWIWVLDRGRVVERSASGEPLRMVGTHLDISARVQAEEELRRSEHSLAITLNSIADGVIAADAAGRVIRINDAARRLTGWSQDSAVGQPLSEVFQMDEGDLTTGGRSGQLRARDGSRRIVELRAAPIRAPEVGMVGTVLAFSDISQRHEALQALRRSERKSRALLDALHAGVVVHAPDGQVADANAAACRILGLDHAQMRDPASRHPDWMLLDADGSELPPQRHPVRQVMGGAEAVRDRVIGLRRPGVQGVGWLLCEAFALREAQGELHEIVVTFYDITDRQRAQEELQRSAMRLRLAGRLARLGGWRYELDSGQLWLSTEAAALLELEAGRPMALDDLLERFAPARRGDIGAAVQRAEHFDTEVDAQGARGRTLSLRVLGEPARDEHGHTVALQGALQDVTESRADQQQLRLLRTAVAQLNDVVLIAEADTAGERFVFANPAFERLSGWTSAQLLGEGTEVPAGARAAAMAAGAGLAEVRHLHRDGGEYWVEQEVVPLRDLAGRITHRVTVQRDITDRKLAEARALAAQQDLEATLEAVPDLLFELDGDGRVRGFHAPRAELLRMLPESFLGRRIDELMPADALAVIRSAMREAAERGYSGGQQYELGLPDGTHWFELSMSRKAGPPGQAPHYLALSRDISERVQGERARLGLERQLLEAQKIESIGTLAGGIAHDFNNILPAILGNVALARQDLPPGHPALLSLDQIQTAGLRARTLVQQILTFSRRQPHVLVVQPLQPVLEETLSLLRATLPAAVRLDTAIAAEPLRVKADATQIQQVMMNLCTNAWHALPAFDGRIEVGLARCDDPAEVMAAGAERPEGPCVHLWVSDNGVGMAPEVVARIFDPFFTTKPVGQGTGLGLSVAHGIVRLHHGGISVRSTPGRGTRFDVLLPLAREAELPAAAADAGGAADLAPAPAGAGARLLYVDDDEVMGLMVRRLLERAGYEVTVTQQPRDAAAMVRAEPARFAVVISDYNMPGMSGIELAALLLESSPGLPLILTSGHLPEELRRQALGLGVRALLQKEQTLDSLCGLVQKLLAGD